MYSGSNSLCLYSLQCAAGAWHWIYIDINMHFVGQLLIFGILLSVFMDIEGWLYEVKVLWNWSMFSGLQCWDNDKGQKDVSTLKECSESLSTSCFIVESILLKMKDFLKECLIIHLSEKPSKSISQTCSKKSGGWTDNRHQISCYCTTDG